jgi:hypothetical protein
MELGRVKSQVSMHSIIEQRVAVGGAASNPGWFDTPPALGGATEEIGMPGCVAKPPGLSDRSTANKER